MMEPEPTAIGPVPLAGVGTGQVRASQGIGTQPDTGISTRVVIGHGGMGAEGEQVSVAGDGGDSLVEQRFFEHLFAAFLGPMRPACHPIAGRG